MKATGIVRRIDDLGRVVIPKEIRRTMRIKEGDPLEIYTDRDGEVIFKKYSPIGEMQNFANEYADTLQKTSSSPIFICDRDAVIACAGVPKKEFNERSLSDELEKIMEGRSFYARSTDGARIKVLRDGGESFVLCAMPIISEGDVIGCVAAICTDEEKQGAHAVPSEVESKLIITAAGFLGRQLEG